ncbi:2-succinyl-5-enolpyruvyl-6-hydroxy-3-cyclohexene-1-carboxylic-acid synthase [Vibrio nigripulchritudo]|nr:2-succinyl-5-enolpyruvyl-6-hydroxy-3-cyclohexene-1-carboxylic-acid synthase [Vibrio nigripulchritudo]
MMIEQASLNRTWAKLILEELTRFGAEHICIAPGSRSTPLTLEADDHPNLNLHCHFDERGLGFYALGIAKSTQKPVAIVVTSGTAVANLLPAVCEANLTGEKLVLLTADRPVELIDCGANQAIEQVGIFSSHVVKALNLPSPNTRISPNWLLSSLDECLHLQAEQGGVIHINCPYPEPLYGGEPVSSDSHYFNGVRAWFTHKKPFTTKHSQVVANSINPNDFATKKGVVILGSLSLEEAQNAKKLGERLGWPIFCDPQSGVSSEYAHFDLWLRNEEAARVLQGCDFVLQFGGRLVSKRLLKWLGDRSETCDYWMVQPYNQRLNPGLRAQNRIATHITQWCLEILDSLHPAEVRFPGWAESLKDISQKTSELIQRSEHALCSETRLTIELFEEQTERTNLFLGNSLIVRLVDMLTSLPDTEVYSNRGASGIDGLIATAAGIHAASGKKSLVMLGDTSLLHDINSLALWTHQEAQPSVIFVSNNDGGAIFDFLPVPANKKRALYQMPHGFLFKHAAMQFGLSYTAPESTQTCIQEIQSHLNRGEGTLLVELITPPEQTSQELKPIVDKVMHDLI